MKYLVTSLSIFDASVMRWEFETYSEASAKKREIKDTGSNFFIVKIEELHTADK
jgi:hypothetical protein